MGENASSADIWATGTTYEPYVGRWSRLVAHEFVPWLALPRASRWLDVGCGTGALSQTILLTAAPRAVTGIDRSAAYVTFAREHVRDARVAFEVGDAQALPVKSASYDAVVAGLMLNFVPQPPQARCNSCANSGMRRWRSIQPLSSWMRGGVSRSVSQHPSHTSFTPPDSDR
jgi:2-polyprenyl-3-methyl-5-hydroxy-6-metoxy-1,4-benzoquinol methylase